MKSIYKRVGNYVKQVNVRNNDLSVTNLQGININKFFMPSVANINGTDLSKYKVVSRKQFAFNPMHVGRDEALPISMLDEEESVIVSPAYAVFKVKDENELLPEYLMMWCRRPEFDRIAWFTTDSSVRGGFSWKDFCNLTLPVPSIGKQRKIVKEYHSIIDRIKLNEQLNYKLEEAAQAIYKQWFVDFEFPVSREYATEIGQSDLEGKPYKSSGGEMVWNDVVDQEIPKGWKVETVKDFCLDMKSGGTPSRSNYEYWNKNDVPWLKTGEIKNNIIIKVSEFISDKGLKNSSAKLLPKDAVLMSMYGVNAGDIGMLKIETSTNQACCGMICTNQCRSAFLYYQLLHNQDFHRSQSIGGAQENLSKDYIEKIPFLIPTDEQIENCKLKKIVSNREYVTKEISLLNNTLYILLSRMAKIKDVECL